LPFLIFKQVINFPIPEKDSPENLKKNYYDSNKCKYF
jgi:hypothetical protein